MTTRPELPPPPPNVARLRVDKRGYPVPWFVAWVNGEPEFRTMEAQKLITAVKQRRCWVCGQPTRGDEAFVIGPMCTVNRVSAEPPSHLACAEYSVKACPFLTKPQMVRRENDMPEATCNPAGHMIRRNPGASCVWVTSAWKIVPDGNGILFRLGDPTAWSWWAEGRTATRAEVERSIETGIPLLTEVIDADDIMQMEELRQAIERSRAYLPAA